MIRHLLSPLRATAIAAILMAEVALADDRAAAEAAVTALLVRTEAILSGPAENRAEALQRLYLGAFDVPALTARAAPPAVWAGASDADRGRLGQLLVCRLAVLTIEQADRTTAPQWILVGSRLDPGTTVVAIRATEADGRERTLLYDLAGPPGAPLILDVRSGDGRLSVRMGEAMLRDAGPPGPDPAAWIASVPCRY